MIAILLRQLRPKVHFQEERGVSLIGIEACPPHYATADHFSLLFVVQPFQLGLRSLAN